MKKKRKWKWIVLLVVLVVVAAIAVTVVYKYFRYDEYKKYITQVKVEEGSDFHALAEKHSDVKGMVLVAENDSFKLYTNLETTEVAVFDKRNGHVNYSNPLDRASKNTKGVNASELCAQLSVTYYNKSGNAATINNYDMSIKHGQFETEALKNGIRYIYTLANPENMASIVPEQISEDRLQSLILDKLEPIDARTVKGKYDLKGSKYILNKKAKQSKVGMSKLNRLFEEAGYTKEDWEKDMADYEGETSLSFTIPLEYRLTENGLEATVPTSKIEEMGSASISRIKVLQFFGAAGTEADGYMFVPNGSGALIDLNNQCKNAAYNQSVYGIDYVSQSFTVTEETEKARMPVFGMKNGDNAFLGRIKGGDALATINADVSGKLNDYNYVYSEFCVREKELLNMFGVSGTKADVPVVEKQMYQENLTLEYTFLTKENADYSGMTREYRRQLIAEGKLTEQTASGELPFYMDIIGGVETKKHFVGVPYDGIYAMTTYEQAGKLVDMLYDDEITNIRLNYKGWFNDGIYHSVADKIKLIKDLGSKDELEQLSKKLEEKGGALFGDVAFQKVSATSDRFNSVLEAAKYYSGYVIELGAVNPAFMRQTSDLGWYEELYYYVVSPKFLCRYIDKFAYKITDYDISGISLRDLGEALSSDKKRTEIIDRQQAEKIVTGQFEVLQKTGKKLMENGGNEYTLKYVSDIIDAPTSYSKFYIIDRQVPFYEMVVHGSIQYAGESMNLMDGDAGDEFILSCIEYGIAPRFTFTYEDPSNMKYTSSADQYSVLYTTWMDSAKSIYKKMKGALADVQGAAMIEHCEVQAKVFRVTYDNGVTIYINKSDQDVVVDQVRIKAMDYKTIGGASNE